MATEIGAKATEIGQSDQVANYRDGATSQARADVVAAVSERKSNRGRKSNAERAAAASADLAKTQEKLAELFKPEVWEPLISLPATAMLSITGRKIWNIPKEDTKAAAASVSVAMQYVGVTNPGALALVIAAVNVTMLYLPRVMAHLGEIRKEREAKEARG